MNLAEKIVAVLLDAEMSPADLIRRTTSFADPEDFVFNSRQIGWPGGWTGNYNYSVSYKPIKVNGRPLYIGNVVGCHDYNRTGHAGLTDYYIDSVPSWSRQYTGYRHGKTGRPLFKSPKYRKHYGYRGMMAMDDPKQQSFDNLMDAARYLLSLVRPNARIEPEFEPEPAKPE